MAPSAVFVNVGIWLDGLGAADLALQQVEVIAAPLVTHVRYRVLPRPAAPPFGIASQGRAS